MQLSTEQITELLANHVESGAGVQELLRMTLEALMRGERRSFLDEWGSGNKGNGYRKASAYGHGRKLELKVPRDRNGAFQPVIMGLLREQDEECDRLVGALYSNGLTQRQVGEVFESVYGEHYSKSSISRMLDDIRLEVSTWLSRPLDKRYAIIYIDALYVKIRSAGKVDPEAFYVMLGVTAERTREVLAIGNLPTESSTGWNGFFAELKLRGVESVGLVVADGLKGLDEALAMHYPDTPLQRCVVHLMRNFTAKVKPAHRAAMVQDLREVFKTGDSSDNPEAGWNRFQTMCSKWSGKKYKSFQAISENPWYLNYFTYLTYDARIQSMIYTTNWIERLQRDFRRVLRMRSVMPNAESVLLLMGKTAMDKTSYRRVVPKLIYDRILFPDSQIEE